MVPDSIQTKEWGTISKLDKAKMPQLHCESWISLSFGEKNSACPQANPYGFFCTICYFLAQGRVLGKKINI